jgi:adenosine deaminase
VTVNSDNQLMSGTTLSREFSLLCDAFDYGIEDIRRLTVNAASVAFIGWDERQRLIADVINPAFARATEPS